MIKENFPIPAKKDYLSPVISEYGSIRVITQSVGTKNKTDTPAGPGANNSRTGAWFHNADLPVHVVDQQSWGLQGISNW